MRDSRRRTGFLRPGELPDRLESLAGRPRATPAQNYVGEIYLKGPGTEPDYARAAQWFDKAAARVRARARINLGYMYEQGLGVTQDTAKALNFYRDASGISGDKPCFFIGHRRGCNRRCGKAGGAGALSSEQRKSEQLRAGRKTQENPRQRQQLRQVAARTSTTRAASWTRKAQARRRQRPVRKLADLDARERALADQQRELEKARQASAKNRRMPKRSR
jgi:hypothetical protein